jgi:uncharacterized protein YlxW (UPF0749 family)
MDLMTMIVAIVLVVLGFSLIVVKWGLAHEEKKMAVRAGRTSAQGDVVRLEQILVATQTEVAKLRERVQVLEKLVTDDDRKLANDIEQLRARDARG